MKLIKDVPKAEFAKWLLVGFGRAWTLGDVFDACGARFDNPAVVADAHQIIPEYWSRATPVRALITEQLPKLAAALDRGLRNAAEVDQAIKAVCQYRKCVKRLHGALSSSERESGARLRKRMQAANLERAGYLARNDIGKHGWKVCK